MSGSIRIDDIVSIVPGVLAAGGNALDLNGLVLTPNVRVPSNQVLSFSSLNGVVAFFGIASDEALAASTYFNGFDNSDQKPGAMLFYQYNTTPTQAAVRGASLANVTLASLQALTGTLNLVINGTPYNLAGLNFAAATSFSSIATIIQTAVQDFGVQVIYFDPLSQNFNVVSPASLSSGSGTSVAFPTGTLAAALGLTQASGAIQSVGLDAQNPASAMTNVTRISRNFASFTTLVEPVLADKLSFASWNNSQGSKYAYVPWDSDGSALVTGSTTCFAYQASLPGYAGSAPVYKDRDKALLIMGIAASIDFNEEEGRVNFAFRGQDGLVPTVTDEVTANTLKANGYNYYGNYSTAEEQFRFLYPGTVTGPYAFLDTYFNQIWLNANLQLALIKLLVSAKSIPYNQAGYAKMDAALLDPINRALSFGAIRAGVTLSQAQIDNVNNAAGLKIDSVLSTRGWYNQILDASPSQRSVRGTPPCKFWYMDGGNIQSINLASVEVQ